MGDYVSRCDVIINGQEMSDVKNYEENEVEHSKVIDLMNHSATIDLPSKYGFSFEYVFPSGRTPFDFTALDGTGTVVVIIEGGGTVTYSGVKLLKEGARKFDRENEAVRTMEFFAKGRLEE